MPIWAQLVPAGATGQALARAIASRWYFATHGRDTILVGSGTRVYLLSIIFSISIRIQYISYLVYC